MTTAYNDAAGRTTTSTIATDLAGATLTDGTYDSAAGTFSITGGGTLTLNGQGNANAVFIFKMASTLITSSSSRVILTNSAQACNVYWQIGSSATLGTSTTLVGNVLALTSITDNGSSTVNGRLLARNGAVTLNKTTITKQTCAVGTTGGPASATSATLRVVKHVVNDSSGSSTASHFTLHVKLSGTDVAGSPAGGVESPGTTYTLTAGTYNVSEDPHGAYSSSFSGYCDANGNITLAAADNKTCTITNDLQPVAASAPANPSQAMLHVVKRVVNNNGGNINASFFKIHVKNSGVEAPGSPAGGNESPGSLFTLNPSIYQVSEDAYSGYTSRFSDDCDRNGFITLASGDNKTCTITNTNVASSPAPKLPNTGFAPKNENFFQPVFATALTVLTLLGISLKRILKPQY